MGNGCGFGGVAAIGVLLAIAGGSASDAMAPRDQLVVVQNIDDIVSLDPAQAYELSSNEILTNVYDRLVEIDRDNSSQVVPGLASAWTVAPDGGSVHFTLRRDARFASGQPVTAEDVAFSLRRVVQLNKAPAGILNELGWTQGNVAEMIRVDSAQAFTLVIAAPISPALLLNLLTADTCSIVERQVALAHEQDHDLGNGWLSRHSAGSGAFSLRQWQPFEAVILDSNPRHYAGAPKLRQVILADVTEPSTQRLMIETGDADIAYDLSPDQIKALGRQGDHSAIRVATYPQGILYFFSLNQRSEKLRNPALWLAMRYLVDYEGIADRLLQGSLTVHQSFWPSGFPGAVDDTPYHLDIARAREILAEGKVPAGLEIDMDVIFASPFLDIAQSLQASMAQAGIALTLLPGTAAQVISKYRARAHEMMLLYWNPDFIDPHSNAEAFAINTDNDNSDGQGTTAWRNNWLIPELTASARRAQIEPDAARRLALYRDLQRQVMASAPWVMMFQVQKQVALRRDLSGFYHGPLAGMLRFDQVVKP